MLVSVFKWDDPYRELKANPVTLGESLRAELEEEYAVLRPRWQGLSLAGLAMILLGIFLFPTLAPERSHELDDIFVYFSGALKAYKFLIMNEEYCGKRK